MQMLATIVVMILISVVLCIFSGEVFFFIAFAIDDFKEHSPRSAAAGLITALVCACMAIIAAMALIMLWRNGGVHY